MEVDRFLHVQTARKLQLRCKLPLHVHAKSVLNVGLLTFPDKLIIHTYIVELSTKPICKDESLDIATDFASYLLSWQPAAQST